MTRAWTKPELRALRDYWMHTTPYELSVVLGGRHTLKDIRSKTLELGFVPGRPPPPEEAEETPVRPETVKRRLRDRA